MLKRYFHLMLATLAALGTVLPGALLPFAARASSPDTISYQGRLRDADGIVVADGDYDFTFTLWNDPDAGVADWTESQTVAVTDGYFSAQLGSVDPFKDGVGQETDFSVPLYLAVAVNAETLTPRVAINAVAYALSSRAAESYASEAAAEAASDPYGGRMYYNTTNGHLYVYDAVGLSWQDTTAAGGGGTLDDSYNNYGTDPAVVTVDNTEGQGNLAFLLDGADFVVQDGGGTFVTFADDGTTTFASTVTFNGQVAIGDNGETVSVNSSDWDISTTGAMTGIGAITSDGLISTSGGLTVSGGDVALSDTSGTTWSVTNAGAATFQSLTVGGDSINDFTGTGLAMSGNALTATLGTSVDSSELTNDTITLSDVAASLTFDTALTFVAADDTNDYALVFDNGSAGDVATMLSFTTSGGGATVATAIDLSDADIGTALALGANDVTVGGATISATELALLDSGIALSELSDSGTLTAGSVDVNGGAIDGTSVGATSASSGAFTTLSSSGITAIGNDTATVAINSSDWDISTSGAMSGISSLQADANALEFQLNLPVSGADAGVHALAFQIDGNTGFSLSATGDGAGGVGVRTVQIGASADADVVQIGDANADVSLTDAQWSIAANGGGALVSLTLSGAAGLDAAGATALAVGNTNASALSLCNGAACDTVQIGTNADADTITIGDVGNDTVTVNGSTFAIDTSDWDITTTGVVTGLNQLSLAFPSPADSTNGMAITNTASTNSYDLLDITITAPNADAAPDAARGISVTMGATGEATDAVKGIVVTGSSSGSGSNFGIELNSGGGATSGDWGLVFGANWDKDIYLTDTSGIFAIADTGNLTFEDDAGNDILVLADVSTANNHVLSGDANTGLSLSGMTTDLTTPVAEDLTIAPGGVGDLVISTDADTQVTLTGNADGVNNLVLTAGNLLVSDGDLTLSGGDFDVTLDAADGASFSNAAATGNLGAVAVSQTTSASNVGNVNGMTVGVTLTDYADDGASDNRHGINVTMTNNAADAGIDDTIFGVRIQNLGGINQSDGGEYGIATGNNWDADWLLGNGETLSNQTDDLLVLSGSGGANNTTLTIDVDGASATVPTIYGGASDLVAVFDGLTIGIDGATTENIGVSGFSIAGGDDLYVNGAAGFNGDVYFDGLFSVGNEVALTTNSATPSVSGGTQFLCNNNAATTISNFTNGQAGQMIFVRVVDTNTTLDCTASSISCGTTDIALGTNDGLLLYKTDPGNWQLVAMMDNSNDHNAGNGFDYAEWFPSRQEILPGTVVSVDPTGVEYVKPSTGAYDRAVVGVVSTQPGMTIGAPATAFAAKIALAGRVPVNVTDENGPILPGDYLVASSTPGYAMKATQAGPVVAIAMGAFDGDSGQVGAKIANFWYTPPTSVASGLQGSDGSALAAGALGADALVVSGDAVFEGSVTVEDHLNVGADVAGRARIIAGDTRVHVAFENPYASEPIVTATVRTATNIPGYWWVEEESTTGFDIVLDGTIATDVEFNWIALGVNGGKVSVSDGSTREINVYVVGAPDAPSAAPDVTPSEPDVSETASSPEEPAVDAPAADEPAVDAPAADEPAVDAPAADEPAVDAPAADPEPPAETEPAVEPSI